MSTEDKQISTTALAKKYNLPTHEMFAHLVKIGLIEKNDDAWVLTNKGVKSGGILVISKNYGEYIAWPEGLEINLWNKKT